MLHQQLQRKQKNFALQRGIYVVRYEKAVDPANPPMVTVVCEAGRNEVILLPEQSRPSMSAPGQALVVRAIETGSVQVEISATGNPAALDATLKFELLRGDVGTASVSPVNQPGMYMPAMAAAPQATVNLQVLGHVARLGDVTVGSDEWLGGPTAPARIEGFLLRWPGRPADVQLRYGATVAGSRPGEARLVDQDEFAGTRGRARPLLGLMMELAGPGARNYNLAVEGLFLGAPVRRSAGQSVNMTGPTGREPLVGLRVAVTAVHAAMQRPGTGAGYGQMVATATRAAGAAAPVAGQPAADNAGVVGEPKRVRVFRA